MSDDAALRSLIAGSSLGVLATVGLDGLPQLSNIAYAFDGQVARVSVTESRVKTRNVARDPRACLHVTTADFWRYAVAECTVTATPLTTRPGDDVGRELLEVYETVRKEPHPDPKEFFAAMVDEGRLVLRLSVQRLYGQA